MASHLKTAKINAKICIKNYNLAQNLKTKFSYPSNSYL